MLLPLQKNSFFYMSSSSSKRKKVEHSKISHLEVKEWCEKNGFALIPRSQLPCKGYCPLPRPALGVGHSGDPVLMCQTCDELCRDCGVPVDTDYDQDDSGPLCYICLMT